MASKASTQTLAPPRFLGGPELDPAALKAFTASLPDSDGEPLETSWHWLQIGFLAAILHHHFRGRTDFYTGCNMFLYYSLHQALNRDYRGPDFFFVNNVDGTRPRRSWIVWEEDGRFPNVIVELLSPTTADEDRTTKKTIYERTFHTPEYFLYDPDTQKLEGFRLSTKKRYRALRPNEHGWLWSEQLQLWIGFWDGTYLNYTGRWLRFYDAERQLVPIAAEAERLRADQEKGRADQEKERADAAEAELRRLKEQIASLGGGEANRTRNGR